MQITAYDSLEADSLLVQQHISHAQITDYQAALAKITHVLTTTAKGEPIDGIAIALAGQVDPTSGRVMSSYSYRRWDGHTMKDDLSRFSCPVMIENDAVVAALGSYHLNRDAGRKVGYIYFARDVGIGAAIIAPANDKLCVYPVEFGHIIVVPDGRSCECGQKGCLEQYIAGRGIVHTKGFATEEIRDEETLIVTARYLTQALMTLLIFYPLDRLYLTGQAVTTQRPFIEAMSSYTKDMLAQKFIFAKPDAILVAAPDMDAIDRGNLVRLAQDEKIINMRYAA